MTLKTRTRHTKTALFVVFGPISIVLGFLHLVYLGMPALTLLSEPSISVLTPLRMISPILSIICFWWAMTTRRVFSKMEIMLIVTFILFETFSAWWFQIITVSVSPSTKPIFEHIFSTLNDPMYLNIASILPVVFFGLMMFVFNKSNSQKFN